MTACRRFGTCLTIFLGASLLSASAEAVQSNDQLTSPPYFAKTALRGRQGRNATESANNRTFSRESPSRGRSLSQNRYGTTVTADEVSRFFNALETLEREDSLHRQHRPSRSPGYNPQLMESNQNALDRSPSYGSPERRRQMYGSPDKNNGSPSGRREDTDAYPYSREYSAVSPNSHERRCRMSPSPYPSRQEFNYPQYDPNYITTNSYDGFDQGHYYKNSKPWLLDHTERPHYPSQYSRDNSPQYSPAYNSSSEQYQPQSRSSVPRRSPSLSPGRIDVTQYVVCDDCVRAEHHRRSLSPPEPYTPRQTVNQQQPKSKPLISESSPVYRQPRMSVYQAPRKPVYEQPQPVYQPKPVYQQPQPVYQPKPVYQQPKPVTSTEPPIATTDSTPLYQPYAPQQLPPQPYAPQQLPPQPYAPQQLPPQQLPPQPYAPQQLPPQQLPPQQLPPQRQSVPQPMPQQVSTPEPAQPPTTPVSDNSDVLKVMLIPHKPDKADKAEKAEKPEKETAEDEDLDDEKPIKTTGKGKGKPAKGKAKPAKGKAKPAKGKGKPAKGKGKPAKGKGKPAK